MKHNYDKTNTSKLIAFVFCLLSITPILAQSNIDLSSSYDKYVNLPREVAYAHLNKSLYVKGETIGFSVYVFDKNTKKPSKQTTNVYAVISDKDNKPIKEQLIWAKDGKANGLFYADSLLTSGNYTFKAYTNWMRNFDEQNYFVQNIKIVDPSEIDIEPEEISSKLDAQFLPEGGHIVANTQNNIGVVIKDAKGFGIPNINGRILDQNDNIITAFKTNQMGIGKFSFRHERNNRYKVDLDFRNRIQTFHLNFGQSKGVNIMLNELRSKVMLTLNTNDQTLPLISGKTYTLMMHNGFKSSTIDFQFDNDTKVSLAVDKKTLKPGLNIFTVFNEKNQPILERLYFNFDGFQTLTASNNIYTRKESDSLAVQIPIKGLEVDESAKISVSVMPAETKSYNAHHNILSYTTLQPYVKGYIENARYYFTDITPKKKFDLDNLLLTQGWSSYNWSNIFNNPPQQLYDFEQGIAFKATSTKHKGDGKFILHTSKNHEAQAYVLKDGETTFSDKGFIIEDEDMLEFTEIISESKMKKASLSVQLRPIKVPSIRPKLDLFNYKEQTRFEANSSDIVFDQSWEKIEQLDEVVIKANLEKKREEELSRKFGGRVDIFDDEKRTNAIDLATYLNGQGYQTTQNFGRLQIFRWRFGEPISPLIYWNGQRVLDFDVFFNFDMRDIDYIAIDLSNKQYDAAQPSPAGSIHIKTDPSIRLKNDKRLKFNQKVGLPLTFTSEKQYYAPKYVYYNTDFFRDYGVIDWIPDAEIDATNTINLKFLDTNTKQVKLFIEGSTSNGKLISEEIQIAVDDI